MNREWFTAVSGVRHGPYSRADILAQIRSGALSPSDYVWCRDFGAQWKRVEEVESLRPKEESDEPSVSPSPVQEAQESAPRASCGDDTRSGAIAAAVRALKRTFSVFFVRTSWRRWLGIGFCVWICSFSGYRLLGVDFADDLVKDFGGLNLSTFSIDTDRFGGEGAARVMINVLADKMVAVVKQGGITENITKSLFALLLALWACWLRSRGDFMLLQRWYDPDVTLRDGWMLSPVPTRTIFRWRLASAVVVLSLLVGCFCIAYPSVIRPYVENGHSLSADAVAAMGTLDIAACYAVPIIVFAAAVLHFMTDHFVVPMLYYRPDAGIGEIWARLGAVLLRRPFGIVAFFAVWCMLQVMFAVTLIGFIMCTLRVGLFLLALPYVGSVVVAPVLYCVRGFAASWLSRRDERIVEKE